MERHLNIVLDQSKLEPSGQPIAKDAKRCKERICRELSYVGDAESHRL